MTQAIALAALVALSGVAAPAAGAGLGSCISGEGEPGWESTFGPRPGVNGFVNAFVEFDGRLCVAGNFTIAGALPFPYIVAWDGTDWSPLGSGLNGQVRALALYDDGLGDGPALYAGGDFTVAGEVEASRVARWNGTEWSPLGLGVGGAVRALTVFDDGSGSGPALYAGGDFTTAGGEPANRIARWDGTAWSALGSGVAGSGAPSVRTMAVYDDGTGPALFVGGAFTSAGGAPAARIARWSGKSWSNLGSGLSDFAFALVVHDDGGGIGPALYVGGSFTTAGGISANRIARWNGQQWTTLGTGFPNGGSVQALRAWNDGMQTRLYAGGSFGNAGGVLASNIASWDGATWAPLGAGVNSAVRTLATFDDGTGDVPALFAGGQFTGSGLISLRFVARWNGGSYAPLGSGLSGSVFTTTLHAERLGGPPQLFAAGAFNVAGGGLARNIARWDGVSWTPLGAGLHSDVFAMATFDEGLGEAPVLVAGGSFLLSGSLPVDRIARWDGTEWSPLGAGFSGPVYALAVHAGAGDSSPALYAAGGFLQSGGVGMNMIARWNGSQWLPLGSGAQSVVFTLASFDEGGPSRVLIAGGFFTTAGGVTVNRIARWDGATWSALGAGFNGTVLALAVFDDGGGAPSLYAAGEFTMSGTTPVARIARWDGVAWSDVGGGFNGIVRALAVHDDGKGEGPVLYAGGDFTSAGGVVANRLARWDGSEWAAVGGGLSDSVWALASVEEQQLEGPGLVVGGAFWTTPFGDSFIARWRTCPEAGPCDAADLDGDGVVSGSDLGALLANWGGAGIGDLNGDGVVDAADLGELLCCW